MSTLADSFLEDLDELSSESGGEEESTGHQLSTDQKEKTEEEEKEGVEPKENAKLEDDLMNGIKSTPRDTSKRGVESVAQLKRSQKYLDHVESIRKYDSSFEAVDPANLTQGSAEYDLVVTSHDLMVQIDDEIAAIYRFVSEIYATKFPELESLIPSAIDYARVVKTIGNETDMTLIDLSKLLPSATIISISVTGSGTSGKPLCPSDLERCLTACDELLSLDQDKAMILRFVESRMKYLAPNASQLAGTRVAAQLIGLAGGVANLARIPACNLQVLGQQKRDLSGFSSASALKHTGVLFYCDLVQSVPPPLRKKATRAVAAKLALAARVDSQPHQKTTDGAIGINFRDELERKFDKWQEPQKAKTKKPLPIPDEKPRRKRGGKRYRKMKERLEMTDVRKEANRQSFATADDEYGDNAMGMTAGRLKQEGSGNLRIKEKKQRQTSKKLRAAKFAAAQKPEVSGLTSSLAFTPVQGIELMNPEAAQKRVDEANKKYFSAQSGFVSVVKKP